MGYKQGFFCISCKREDSSCAALLAVYYESSYLYSLHMFTCEKKGLRGRVNGHGFRGEGGEW